MGITTGHEEAWIKMMLEDDRMLEEMGLPKNMSDMEKEAVVQAILADPNFENFRGDDSFTMPNESIPMDNETPAQMMMREAMEDMGISSESRVVTADELEIGTKYKITFPNDKEAIVLLIKILPNSFGDDYIFENIRGADSLCGRASELITENQFPLPKQLLATTKFETI